MKPERLQKILAQAGIASRRASELLIQAGRVSVNGHVVTQMGIKVNPATDKVTVDGEPLAQTDPLIYIAVHKPVDVLSTAQDDRGRMTVVDLVDIPERVYPVGRLDIQSEGLLLLTNDGDLAEKLTHPRYHIEKEYQVLVTGKPSPEALRKWREGKIKLEEFTPQPAIVKYLNGEADATWLTVIMHEGHKRQIRLIAEKLGHPVKKLIRVRIGTIQLGKLKVGHWRKLNPTEIQQLRHLTSDKPPRVKPTKALTAPTKPASKSRPSKLVADKSPRVKPTKAVTKPASKARPRPARD